MCAYYTIVYPVQRVYLSWSNILLKDCTEILPMRSSETWRHSCTIGIDEYLTTLMKRSYPHIESLRGSWRFEETYCVHEGRRRRHQQNSHSAEKTRKAVYTYSSTGPAIVQGCVQRFHLHYSGHLHYSEECLNSAGSALLTFWISHNSAGPALLRRCLTSWCGVHALLG